MSEEKMPVSIYLLHSILGGLLTLSDEEAQELMTLDGKNADVVRSVVQQWIVPDFFEYEEESQEKIRNSLEYFLAIDDPRLERILPACQVSIEPVSGKEFFSIVRTELFGDTPLVISPDNYTEVSGVEFAQGIRKKAWSKK